MFGAQRGRSCCVLDERAEALASPRFRREKCRYLSHAEAFRHARAVTPPSGAGYERVSAPSILCRYAPGPDGACSVQVRRNQRSSASERTLEWSEQALECRRNRRSSGRRIRTGFHGDRTTKPCGGGAEPVNFLAATLGERISEPLGFWLPLVMRGLFVHCVCALALPVRFHRADVPRW